MIIVCIGASCSGKSTYARRLEKEGYHYINFEKMWNYTKKPIEEFLLELTNIVKSGTGNFVIDGYPITIDKKCIRLKEYIDVEFAVLFAPVWMIRERQKSRRIEAVDMGIEKWYTPLSEDRIKKAYGYFLNMIDISHTKFINSTDLEFTSVEHEEFEKILNGDKKVDIKIYLDSLDIEHYNKYYQSIDGVIQGESKTELTWDKIKDLVDWKRKKVLDIGCNHGYISFKVKEEGAKEVTGIDIHPHALNTARIIRGQKRINVVFRCEDIDENERYDIALILNVLGHIKNKKEFLEKAFKVAKQVVFETKVFEIKESAEHRKKEGKTIVVIPSTSYLDGDENGK